MRKLILSAITLALVSCGASIKSNFTTQLAPISMDQKVAILDLKNEVPSGAQKIGTASYGDTGFSTDCDFNSNLINARKIARQNGANVIKVTEKKEPNFFGSSCYRIKVDFYSYQGDVTQLDQYQIQIN
ncbi:hypothetical protein [Flavobacterium turcicum]|uniref:Lipoprotein n=1 Tax=Flavobacterium turcicum TaxID=2764718 RepID=A0ABR7JGE9_9FLAO|nr:hypothetical protein [Flavobacterium turcicum]MBC5863321.1 hypothetical protein [Flavobacterium turcicum]NHL02053.1 hypothetical protein [Flavobacterium turcicum]